MVFINLAHKIVKVKVFLQNTVKETTLSLQTENEHNRVQQIPYPTIDISLNPIDYSFTLRSISSYASCTISSTVLCTFPAL